MVLGLVCWCAWRWFVCVHYCVLFRLEDCVTTELSLHGWYQCLLSDHCPWGHPCNHLWHARAGVSQLVPQSGRVEGFASSPLRRRRTQARRVPGLLSLRKPALSGNSGTQSWPLWFLPGSSSSSFSDAALYLWCRTCKCVNSRDGDTLAASTWAPSCCL